MGLNTVVLILNDHIADIERRSAIFCARLHSMIAAGQTGEVIAGAKIISTAHADAVQIVGVHGNIGEEFGPDVLSQKGLAVVREGLAVVRDELGMRK